MEHIIEPITTHVVRLSIEEVEMIIGLTQNLPQPSSTEEQQTALGLFVGMSRILGYDVDDDGTIKRTSI